MRQSSTPSFDRYGPVSPASPVVISVPHGGREYPEALIAMLRVPLATLLPLEDRHIDRLALATRRYETMFVARRARAWIDLNRAEHERDPQLDDGARTGNLSAKVRGGLGLVPRQISGAGALWSRRLGADEVTARVVADHRPYHAALAEALDAARARFGIAVLVDLHSMPPIAGDRAPTLVLGDRFGRAAGARLVERVERAARATGAVVALNAPYAGGHILDRHGAPARGRHAIQLEVSRDAYLDAALSEPGLGFGATARLLRTILDALADEVQPVPLAAE